MTTPDILLTQDRGAVRILTLNRPQKRNALNTALTQALLENRVVADADADLISATMDLAQKLAAVSSPAMKITKQLFHEVADLLLEEALKRGRETNKRMRAFRKA